MPIDALYEAIRNAPKQTGQQSSPAQSAQPQAASSFLQAAAAAHPTVQPEAPAPTAAPATPADLWNGYDYNAEAERRAQVGGYTPAPEAFRAPAPTNEYDPSRQAQIMAQAWQPQTSVETSYNNKAAYIPGTQIPYDTERGQQYLALEAQRDAARKAFEPFRTIPGANDAAANIVRDIDTRESALKDYLSDEEYFADKASQQKAYDAYQRQQSMDATEAGNQLAELYRQRDELQKLISTTSSAFRDRQGQALNSARQEQLAKINAQIRQYETDTAAVERNRQNEAVYRILMNNPDFEQNSQYTPREDGKWGEIDLVNNNRDAWLKYDAQTGGVPAGGTVDPIRTWEYLTDDERKIYNYLYNTQGYDAAKQYIGFLQTDLNARDANAKAVWAKDIAKENPVAASLFSVVTSPLKGVSAVAAYGDTLKSLGGDNKLPGSSLASKITAMQANSHNNNSIDPNDPVYSFSRLPNTIRSQVSRDIERNYGKAGSFGYQTGMSVLDNLWQMALTGGAAGESFMLGMMGSGAMADSVLAAKERGLSDGQALALGLASGAIEAVTEKIGLDALYEGIRGGKTALRAILNSTLAEGSEEVLGTFLDDIADMIIAGTDSERLQRIAELKAQGMSDSEAAGRAYVELLKEAGVAGLSGALSGLLMSGGAQAIINGYHSAQEGIQTAKDTREQNRVNEMVRMANEEAAKRYANILNPQNAAQTEQTAEAPQIAPEAPAQTATPAPTPVQTTNDTAAQTTQETPIQNGETSEVLWTHPSDNSGWKDQYNGDNPTYDALQTVDPKLFNAFIAEGNEAEGKVNYPTPIIDAYISAYNDVRQGTISPMAAATLLSNPYNEGGTAALTALYNPSTGNLVSSALETAKQIDAQHTAQTLGNTVGAAQTGGGVAPLAPENEESSVGAATAGQFTTEYDELGEKYGWQDVTAKDAAYAVRYPRSTNGKDRVSATVGNALSARVTDDYMASLIEANTVKGAYSFIPISNDATTRKATRRIKNIGWEAAMKEFHDAARTGKNSADLQAMGMILYNNAVNSGDYQAALNILADFQVSGTTIARALQIRQILRKLTPEGKLYSIQKAVKDLDQKLTNNGRNMIGEPFVFEYSDAVGRKIADGVAKKLKVKSPKAQTFLQHIAAEISEIANEQIPADVKEDTKRARRDFVRDYILNHDFFDEAYQKAKEEIVRQYEDRGEEIPPELEELLNSSLRDAMYEQLVGRSDVTISDDALEAFAYAQTPTEEQEAMKRIAKEISSQLPSTLEEKINALRYLNMLGNFRTQNRNILGNSAMFLAASAKYYTAAGIERIVSRINPNFEKSKAVNPGKARLDAARQAFKTYEDYVLGEAKYNDMNSRSSNEIMRMAEDEKTVFKFGDNRLTRALGIANKQGPVGKALQAMSNATNWMMEHGDIPFAKVSFVRSLAGYMAAHNVTAEQWNNPEWQMRNASFVDKAVQYAANQAQQDTFRDNNAFSTWVSKFGRTPNTPKAARVALEGLLPFRKTPANVTVRAVEYSPLGIVTTAIDAVKAAQGGEKNGRVVTGADIVDDIAKNFTGTALVALGWILAKQGLLRGGDDDDDRVAAWNDQLGHQSYSIEIGGTSYTLDWVAPAAIPLFIGAEIFNATKDKNYSFSDLEAAFTKITEPMLKMSMLQSVDDFLNGGYDSNGLQKVAQLGASYLTQGLTSTLLGQFERTLFEPNRVATYKDPTRNMPKWLQGAIGKASAKIPGIDAYQYEYVDLWGRSESNGSMWERALTNFLSPGYVSHVDMDSVETEIQRLYDYLTESGSDEASSVLPAAVKRTGLSREDYVKKAQTVGAARAGVLASMFKSPAYKAMSPEDQAKAISCVYEYANAAAKDDTSKSAKWIRDALKSPNPAQVILSHVKAG